MKNLVFVYGTLKKGFGNNNLLENSKFISKGFIKATMYSLGGCPTISDGESKVFGEIYEVSNYVFKKLDMLEGYPHGYNRKIIQVNTKNGIKKTWVYFFENHKVKTLVKIPNGVW